jgi:hypothetical protein
MLVAMSARRIAPLAVVALAALLAGPSPAGAETLRCEAGIVAVGDWKLDLLGKCGQPTHREVLTAPAGAVGLRGGSQARASEERWTYDLGPGAFLHQVTLEVGVVKAIERGGYGHDTGQPRPEPAMVPRARCELADGFKVGDSTSEVLARCGEPVTRDETLGQVAVEGPLGLGSQAPIGLATVRLELWVYDFGPRANIRRLEFEDGRLARIVTGGYGYSR